VTAPTYDLGKLHGGLRLDAHKRASTAGRIVEAPLPQHIVLPLEQHAGGPAQPLVTIGERVLRGQLIAEPGTSHSAPVHASSSGTVVAIEDRPVSRCKGDPAPCIVLECDGLDEAAPVSANTDYLSAAPGDLLMRILNGGIVGLGGAVFPTAQKLAQARERGVEHLVLNGVECEPYISCDDMLMREHAAETLRGAQILMHALQVESCEVAIESDKPVAIQKVAEALAELDDDRIAIKQVPAVYPSGGEDQLVQLLLNREVPSGGLPIDIGCVVQNVGTAAAVHDWIVNANPLISRITTITGDGVARPVNVRARIGTPVSDLVACAGGYTERAHHLVLGGPMTGRSVSTDEVPLVKASNCILVLSRSQDHGRILPCIRCGDCAAACPVQLLPQQLYWYAAAQDEDKLGTLGLTDCIECGCCDLVCPSRIPLTVDFRRAKVRIRKLEHEKARAQHTRRRFDARNARLAREEKERAEELARQKETAKVAGPAAIAEILKRRKEKDGQS
jgi:electron transport complex protein RnfC